MNVSASFIYPKDSESSPENSPKRANRSHTIYPQLSRKDTGKKKNTEILEFNFHNIVKKEIINLRKISVGQPLLQRIMKKKIEYIKKRSNMSNRMINRTISTIYQNAIEKLNSDERLENLVDLTYDEIYHRYGVKTAADKKFRDFIYSLFSNTIHKKSLLFLKFLQCGSKLGAKNYTNSSFSLYLKCLDFMLTMNIGIMPGYLDTSDNNMFPTLRAIECVKDKIDFSKASLIPVILHQIDAKTIQDPKRININGLIEIETFLEVVIETYEDYQLKIEEGIFMLITGFGLNASREIPQALLFLIFRHVEGSKAGLMHKDENYNYGDLSPKNRYYSILTLLTAPVIFYNDLMNACVESNIFKISDVKDFCDYEKIENYDKSRIELEKIEMMNTLSLMKKSANNKWKSLSEDEFEFYIHKIEK